MFLSDISPQLFKCHCHYSDSDKTCIAWMHCKSLWIKASAKCINVNVNYVGRQNAEKNISLGVVKEMFHKIRNRLS